MKSDKTLGKQLHVVSNLLDRRMNAIFSGNGVEGITPMHGMFLGFLRLHHGQDHEVYQKDMEAEFDIARSTVTATLKLMEKKGYIRRETVEHDARLKRIILTPHGEKALTLIHSSIQQSELLMRSALTEQEFEELMRLLECVKSTLYTGSN